MSVDACAELLERGDPDRFMAVLAAPLPAREILLPLYAFNLEIARIPWVASEPMIAEMRLQWWRDILTEPFPRAHPVAAPLHALIAGAGLPVDVLDRMIEARRWDIWREGFAGEADLDRYLDETVAGLTWLAACALGADPRAEEAVRDYGWASAVAAFLRAVPELEASGRHPLPDRQERTIATLARRGLDRLERARSASHRIPRRARPALLAGWQTAPLLQQAARDPAAVRAGLLHLSDFERRGRLLWQAVTGRF